MPFAFGILNAIPKYLRQIPFYRKRAVMFAICIDRKMLKTATLILHANIRSKHMAR
jgi:hypothetical protein